MTYSIEIAPSARREWSKLDPGIKRQFIKKLESIRDNPRVHSARLRMYRDAFKIKLRSAGYRLVYKVIDDRLIILVIAVAKRDATKADVYDLAKQRLGKLD